MFNSIDKEIVLDMSSTEDTKHYRRYLTDRFVVEDIHDTGMGFCAVIKDMEMGMSMKHLTGEQLADGTVEVTKDGVIYHPPRADVESFVLPHQQEMAPIGNHLIARKRNDMNQDLMHEHVMMPQDDEDDKLIIVLSANPTM